MSKRYQSPTSINTYLRCPRKYYLRYIKGLKSKPSIHLVRGKAVHDAISQFTQMDFDRFSDPKRLKNTLLNLFKTNWQEQKSEIQKLGIDEKTLKQFYHESQSMLLGWLKRYAKDGYKKPKTEVKLFSKTHGAMGIIDAVISNKGIILLDYKTSSKNDITHDIKVQLSLYALLYTVNYRKMPDVVAVDFLKHQEIRRFQVNKGLIQFAAQILRNIHKSTTSTDEKDYPCKCGGWCENEFIF